MHLYVMHINTFFKLLSVKKITKPSHFAADAIKPGDPEMAAVWLTAHLSRQELLCLPQSLGQPMNDCTDKAYFWIKTFRLEKYIDISVYSNSYRLMPDALPELLIVWGKRLITSQKEPKNMHVLQVVKQQLWIYFGLDWDRPLGYFYIHSQE